MPRHINGSHFWHAPFSLFSLMIIGNIIILVLFWKVLKNRSQLGVTTDNTHLVFLTKLLVTNSMGYLILSVPWVIYLLTAEHVRRLYTSDGEYEGAFALWRSIASCLICINHAINFFLYCLSAKKFRDELKAILGCFNSVHPVTDTVEGEESEHEVQEWTEEELFKRNDSIKKHQLDYDQSTVWHKSFRKLVFIVPGESFQQAYWRTSNGTSIACINCSLEKKGNVPVVKNTTDTSRV